MNTPKPSELNDAQWKAVCHEGSHLIISAGPGTGKTHTITHRILRVIKSLKPKQKVLAITFTNRAAEEMQERLALQLESYAESALVCTFHRFALTLLRDYAEYVALPKDFQIALPEDIQEWSKEMFPDKSPTQRKEALQQISLEKSTRLVLDPSKDYQAYHRFLRAKQCIDFDDILREALVLLENEEVLTAVRDRFAHIFVDEYQDINLIQSAILKALIVNGSAGLTVIGDVNQSIYGFRGSCAQLFESFCQDFEGASLMRLNENYRSAPNLLTASTQLMTIPGTKALVPPLARIHDEGRLVIHESSTDRSEAEYIAHQIEQLVGGVSMFSHDSKRAETSNQASYSFGDIAVLYRLNAQKNVIAQALEHLGIPYTTSDREPVAQNDLSNLSQSQRDDKALKCFEEAVEYKVERVCLLTMHAAKGLEFPVVFIAGCEETLLPLDIEGMKGDPAEERRLFYVAMTRAKAHLYLTRSGRRQIFGKRYFNSASIFLADIEEDLKIYEQAKKHKMSRSKEADQQLKLF